MNIYALKKQIPQEEVDYLLLKSLLVNTAFPRDKITQFLKNKALIRIKKGLYVFGPDIAQKPFSTELLANLIYGPSAISLEYALSFYGMIPERVYTLTSITNKRNKHFSTPAGEFTYRYLSPLKYAMGIARLSIDGRHIFIATPEKALADVLLFSPIKKNIKTTEQLAHYLLEDLRIDPATFSTLNTDLLQAIAIVYRSAIINLLIDYLQVSA